jgi:hypothetical protein
MIFRGFRDLLVFVGLVEVDGLGGLCCSCCRYRYRYRGGVGLVGLVVVLCRVVLYLELMLMLTVYFFESDLIWSGLGAWMDGWMVT